jgi:putative DNA primase/helicase
VGIVFKCSFSCTQNKSGEIYMTEIIPTPNGDKEEKGPKPVMITHSMLADEMIARYAFFALEDSREFYIYRDGVYSNSGSELRMEKMIRDSYKTLYRGLESEDKHFGNPRDAKSTVVTETLKLLRAEYAISRDELDKIQEMSRVLNFKNCLLKIKTGEIMPHSPNYKSIRQFPVTYDPVAKCPAIEKFLDENVSPEDKELLIEVIGYFMIPDISIQKAVMLYGPPRTGKSKFLSLLEAVLGKRNCAHKSLQQLEDDQRAIAGIYGKLVNIYPDLRDGIMAHDNIFKAVVGGDRLSAERKYEHAFDFDNTCRLIFSGSSSVM